MSELNNILIIDDDDVSNFIYKRVIEANAVAKNITTLTRGRDALEYLEKIIENEPDNFPEIIFLDINMPVMNGWQFLETYREQLHSRIQKNVLLCMISSSVYQEDITKAYSYPEVSEYISKPLTSQILNDLLSKYFG